MNAPRAARRKARVCGQIALPHGPRQSAPKHIIHNANRHMAIFGGEYAKGGQQRVGVAFGGRNGAVEVVLIDQALTQADHRVIHGDVQELPAPCCFGLPQGECFGFLGINGAGKTTTLKILTGDVVPTSGGARLGGHDILREQEAVRRLIGYCPQFDAILDLMSVREHLELYARIKGVPEATLARVVGDKVREMDLGAYEGKLAGSLSGGNKRKLGVAIAMIGAPRLIFLDEPSTGMDPVARRFMWSVIARVATERKQCSIILTTHSMEEVEALCEALEAEKKAAEAAAKGGKD